MRAAAAKRGAAAAAAARVKRNKYLNDIPGLVFFLPLALETCVRDTCGMLGAAKPGASRPAPTHVSCSARCVAICSSRTTRPRDVLPLKCKCTYMGGGEAAGRLVSSRLYRSLGPHCRLYTFSKWRDLLCRPGSCTGHFVPTASYKLSQNGGTWVCRPADCTGHSPSLPPLHFLKMA